MKIKLLILVLVVAVLSACGGEEATEEPPPPATEAPTATTQAEETAPEPTATEAVSEEENTEKEMADSENDAADEAGMTTDSGLQYVILEEGDGASPKPGDVVSVHYAGSLEDGTEFDNSYKRGEPIQFALGTGQVIPGWDEGIALLKVGDKARLTIPSELAYGENGAGAVIPPNATLIFEVELMGIQEGAPAAPIEYSEDDLTETESGLKYYDIEEGTGATPENGQPVTAHYTGWLEDGTKFDSSLDRGQPFQFVVGVGQVIPGWDEGIGTMKVGGKRLLVIPSDLAYGEAGAGGVIPPNATLIFEVELLAAGQ